MPATLRYSLPVVVLMCVSSLFAQGALMLQDLYGTRIQAAAATLDRADDRELAKDLYDAAQKLSNDPDLLAAMCDKVYELSHRDPESYGLAADAMQLLAERVPERKFDALTAAASLLQKALDIVGDADPNRPLLTERFIDVLLEMANLYQAENQWDAAQAYAQQAVDLAEQSLSHRQLEIRHAADQLKTRRRVAHLTRVRASDPTNTEAADELLRLHLLELNDPASAAEYQFTATNELLKRHVAEATRDIDTLNALQALTLANWYRELLTPASPGARIALKKRAAGYYERYLELQPFDNEQRRQAAAALAGLDDFVAELNGADAGQAVAARPTPTPAASAPAASPDPAMTDNTPPAGAPGVPPLPTGDGWVDLFANFDLMADAGRGLWNFTDGALNGEPPTPAQFTLPTIPVGDYVLVTQFKRTSSIGSVALHLPVKDNRVLVVFGDRRRRQRDYIAGLSTIDDQPAQENSTATPFQLETDKVYTARVEIKTDGFDTHIASYIDDELIFEWRGNSAHLNVSKAWSRFAPNALGLGIDGAGSVTFFGARYKSLTGTPPKPLRG